MGIDLSAALHEHGDSIIRVVAGGALNLDRYDWLKIHLSSLMNPVNLTTDLRLIVRLEEHTHRVGNVSFRPQRAEWVTGLSIADRDLRLHRDPSHVLRVALEQIFDSVSPRLFEHDPRIGMFPPTEMPQGGQPYQPLPRSPLFDPRSLFPTPDLSASAAYNDPWRQDNPPPLWVYGKCRFCGDDFYKGMPMWGGGNLMWVHQPCWMRVVGQ